MKHRRSRRSRRTRSCPRIWALSSDSEKLSAQIPRGITCEKAKIQIWHHTILKLNALFEHEEENWRNTTPSLCEEQFISKFFLQEKTAALRVEITMFRRGMAETIYDAWSRFKKMLRNCPNHDIPRHIQVHTFYHGLIDGGKDKLDHLSGDSFLSGTTAECHNLLNNLVANYYEKKPERATPSKITRVIEVDQVTTLNAKIDSLIQSMKNFDDKAQCQAVTLHNDRELQEIVKEAAKAKGNEVTSEENEKEVEAPLEIKAFEQIPSYVKFIKDILPKKRRLGDYETVALTEECSAIIQNKLPPKLKDPRNFMIPCTIGTHFSGRALCNLGDSINLMPYSIYQTLGLGEAKSTSITLQLANRSLTYPKGVIEDILVKVDKFIFPADFVVLDIEVDSEIPNILGRPFLATGRTLIDIQKGELTIRVQDQQITFNVFKAMKFPKESDECCSVSIFDNLAGKESIAERTMDPHEHALLGQIDEENEEDHEVVKTLDALKFLKSRGVESLERTEPSKVLKPSIKEPPTLELKPLPSHLCYSYLGESDTLPVIISFSLSDLQVVKLLRVLRNHKYTIGWTIADIKGISPSFCMHKTLL
ncbi:hypothetical protein CDL12_06610 [Handroanthus impetiginosus]|uniref:Retrotransposon gag domain-containing protein n=1 Tax=Handroanthus impetiginosus TaxID=429701 RepID=A0A2G9HT49_9LAMI|nr:hypothetical protein CDL12_06610 [Handroanthus impetiginosus]